MVALSRRSVGVRRLSLSPRFLVLLEVLLAALLSILYIGDDSIWLDEGFSIAMAREGLSGIWDAFLIEANQGVYYILLHFWLQLGDSEAAIRSLSAVFAVGTVPFVYALGARLFGVRTGLMAALLLAVNAYFIDYAQEARGYALYLLLATAASYAFVRAVEDNRPRYWIAYVLLGTLAVYTQLFAGLVLIAHASSLVFLRRDSIPWRELIAAGGGLFLFLLPLAVLTLSQSDEGALRWVRPVTLTRIAFFFKDFSGSRALLLAYFLVCAVALVPVARAWLQARGSIESWRYAFVLTWFAVPILIVIALSLTVRPLFVTRYLIACLPPLVLIAAIGLSQIRQPALFGAAVGVIVLLSLLAVRSVYVNPSEEDWRGAAQHVLARSQPGDAALFYIDGSRASFDYYRRREAATVPVTFNYQEPGPDGHSASDILRHGLPLIDGFEDQLARDHPRVWFFVSRDNAPIVGRIDESEPVEQRLRERYTESSTVHYPAIRVTLYELTRP
jgi:4-amino-4-deoxy-L-arabinose transferase-like glycosyltransferase